MHGKTLKFSSITMAVISYMKTRLNSICDRKNENEKSEDYSKADLKQRVLFFYNNVSAGHTSLLQVYRYFERRISFF